MSLSRALSGAEFLKGAAVPQSDCNKFQILHNIFLFERNILQFFTSFGYFFKAFFGVYVNLSAQNFPKEI